MAKIYERLLSTNILREKRRHSFDPQRVTLLGEDSICMVNLLETPRVIVFFFNEAMILALAGQFKQLSHEPEKFRFMRQLLKLSSKCEDHSFI